MHHGLHGASFLLSVQMTQNVYDTKKGGVRND